ncbi:unnamed protein product [Aphanomyces euteiches]|uniref:WRKY transcription factor 19 n=1 Tax=Aphanomyces euteiches TaxID=100861 RepID=A0A6G0WHN0_9STRA|nr:hypothetical protein Ae201684_015104 [Aphanomyces euteiches]KAH9063019.1 hypothetical protein Ae201684P_009284 [Aphanomyces euteiches]KAH9144189.1 hypothetical protein AeRB84_011848 [Aphanomyces euteiches]
MSCFFNDCENAAAAGSWKCSFHKNCSRCLADDCKNQVYARKLCVRHGGKRRCDVPDCDRNVRLGSFCSAHSSAIVKKICEEEGCTNVAHNRQRCVRHGGGRKCKIQGCKTHARSGGYCCRHSHKEAISPLSILTDSAPDIDVNLTPADEWKFWQELSFDGLPTADESMAKALTHSIDIISVVWDDFMSSAPDEMFAVDQCNYS